MNQIKHFTNQNLNWFIVNLKQFQVWKSKILFSYYSPLNIELFSDSPDIFTCYVKNVSLYVLRGHFITKHTGGWLEGLSQKPQNIYSKIAIFKKC